MVKLNHRWVLFFVILLIFLTGSIGFVYFLWQRSLPNYRGTHSLTGLTDTVEVKWDEHGIPWIETSHLADAYKVQGYITARDRFFQMELTRRKISGTLAEVFGPRAVDSDIKSRKWGYREAARLSASQLPPDRKQLLESYAEGINHYLAHDPRPWECQLLNYRPKPWTIEDTFSVVLSMYESLNAPMSNAEEAMAILRTKLSPSLVSFFTLDWGFLDAPILADPPALPEPKFPTPQEFTVRKNSSSLLPIKSDFEPGSNAWVISGKRSTSGAPLLASDPHLDLRIPNIWYRLGIKWSAGKVVGASIPGMPGIVIGRNQDVAWAFTNSSVDNIDRIEIPKNSPEITVRREFIPIKGSPPMEVTLQLSPWGPIVDESEDKFTAIQWTALDPQNLKELDLSALNNAKNSQELLSAFEHWAGPPQNALFATRTGDIGWTLAGKLPKRTGFDGLSKIHRTPQTKWEGYVERSRFPVVINPPEGFIASANQRTVGIGKDLPLFGSHWPSPARAKRIRTLLQGKAKWNAVDCSQVQADNTSLTHLWYRDQVLTCPIDPSDPEHSLWLSPLYELIRNWNGTTSVDSSAFPVLRQFRYEIFLNLLSPISREISVIHEEILLDRISHDALVKKLWERKPRHLLSPSFSSYCSAFQKSLISAARQLVSEPSQLTTIRWGEMNRSEINHPLSRALPSFFQTVLNMPSTELAGDSLVPNVMTPRNGASMRLVMDLSDFKNSLFTQPGGQSGHPLSQHYNDLFSHWVKSEPVPFSSQHFSTQERFVPGATLGTRD